MRPDHNQQEVEERQKPGTKQSHGEKVVNDIRQRRANSILPRKRSKMSHWKLATSGLIAMTLATTQLHASPNNQYIDVDCTAAKSPCYRSDVIPNEEHYIYTGMCTENPDPTPSKMTCVGDAKYVKCTMTDNNSSCNCLDRNALQGGEATVTVYCD